MDAQPELALLTKVLQEQGLEAIKLESDRALTELIRFRLSLPPEKRLNVLRKKIGLRATCL